MLQRTPTVNDDIPTGMPPRTGASTTPYGSHDCEGVRQDDFLGLAVMNASQFIHPSLDYFWPGFSLRWLQINQSLACTTRDVVSCQGRARGLDWHGAGFFRETVYVSIGWPRGLMDTAECRFNSGQKGLAISRYDWKGSQCS